MKILMTFLVFLWSMGIGSAQVKPIELSHYIFPDFTKGKVIFKEGSPREAQLNYNSLTREMVFHDRGEILAMSEADLARVDTVIIEGRRFFLMDDNFVELAYSGVNELYLEHRCRVLRPGSRGAYGTESHSSASTSYASLVSAGHVYQLELPDGYQADPYLVFLVKRDGELNRFANMRQLRRAFRDQRDDIRSFTREHEVNFNEAESVVKLIRYLESKD